ncbi:MAG: S8 family serine peptidase, partial [Candidatus Kerfeldbacteria bacterium]|nr:S8 family serine peptidase [Candidatus Kerfeldbacteria bacterium]
MKDRQRAWITSVRLMQLLLFLSCIILLARPVRGVTLTTVLVGMSGDENPSPGELWNTLETVDTRSTILSLRPLSGTPATYAADLLTSDTRASLQSFNRLPSIRYAERDGTVHAFFVPDDPSYPAQWNFEKVNVAAAWDVDTREPLYGGDPSIVVAVIDTGVAFESYVDGGTTYGAAPDFASTRFVAGYDFVNNDTHPNDDNGHGTHVAGTIAESTNNTLSAAGIAFQTSVMPIKVLDSNGDGDTSDVVSAVNFAVDNGADVINLSLGSPTPSQALFDAVQRARTAGVVVVAATGNDSASGLQPIAYPAAYDGVVAVTALARADTRASYANTGTGVTLAAPGGDGSDFILQQTFSNLDVNNLPKDYTTFGVVGYQGTSQAAPHVSGAAALLLAQGASSDAVKNLLQSTATDLGDSGYDTTFGYGKLNIHAAIMAFLNDTTAPSSSAATSPAQPDGLTGWYRSKPSVSLSATDTEGSGVASISYFWDTTAAAAYTEPLTPPEGSHTLSYFATDNAGNKEATRQLNFLVDSVVPALALNIPGTTTTRTKVRITGKATDAASGVASLALDGSPVALGTDGSFSFSRSFPVGVSTLSFVATDVAGNQVTVERTVSASKKEGIVLGTGPGGVPRVLRVSDSGKILASFLAYPSTFQGGVNVASGDLNGDGIEEILAAARSQGRAGVKIFSRTGKLAGFFNAYAKSFRGGINLTTADINGDGQMEIVTVPTTGAAPQVRVFDRNGKALFQFFAFAKTFKGGVSVAAGDVDGDGTDEIIVAPSSIAGPQV